MKLHLLLASLTAVALVGAPLVATAQTTEPEPQSESRDLANFVDPDANDDQSESGSPDIEGAVSSSEPSGGEGGGGTGGDSAE